MSEAECGVVKRSAVADKPRPLATDGLKRTACRASAAGSRDAARCGPGKARDRAIDSAPSPLPIPWGLSKRRAFAKARGSWQTHTHDSIG